MNPLCSTEERTSWNIMRVSKWSHNFHLWGEMY